MGNLVWFSEVGKYDVALVGGKGANLGEMINNGIPIPNGFIITVNAYHEFIEANDLDSKVSACLNGLNTSDYMALTKASKAVKKLILDCKMPVSVLKEIEAFSKELGVECLVAVRSSATAEDMPDASFAGQQKTYLNVKGVEEICMAVKECWASLFETRAIFYRVENNYDHLSVGIAVPVQLMVQSASSGVMFTMEPIDSDKTKMVIEAIYGLGEAIVGGEITPDYYLIDKETGAVIQSEISSQSWMLAGSGESRSWDSLNHREAVIPHKKKAPKITKTMLDKLIKIGIRLEEHYGSPQDIEWAVEKNKLYITQSRPITTESAHGDAVEINATAIMVGGAASPGIASGRVRVLLDPNDTGNFKDGDILVTDMTTPDYVPAMKRAIAIITCRGGRTSHAAIVSRELGVPCVVGVPDAISLLKEGTLVTVDGTFGKIYEGEVS